MHPRILLLLSKMYKHYYGSSIKDVLIHLQLNKIVRDVDDELVDFFRSIDREDLKKVIEDILENEDAKSDERELWRHIPNVTGLTSLIEIERVRSTIHDSPPPQCYWRAQLLGYLYDEEIGYDETKGVLIFQDQRQKKNPEPNNQSLATKPDPEENIESTHSHEINERTKDKAILGEYFHVRVIRTKDRENEAIQFDLEKSHLLEDIVNKYNEEGITKFSCGSYIIDSSDIEQIEIYLTTEPSSAMVASSMALNSNERLLEKWDAIKSKGKEVTGKFIKFPTNPWHDKRLICLGGHVINNSYINKREKNKPYCNTCGKKTITTCQNCNAAMKGDQYKPYHDYLGPSAEAPYYCDNCGKEFPWTKILLSKTIDLNDEPVKWLENFVNRFNLVVKRLEQKRNNKRLLKVTNEYDLQGLVHALLFLRFDDIRPEDPTPILAGRSARMDFVLKEEEAVLELKITKPGHDDREIGEELLKDIAKYSERQDCKTLIFFIYDKEGVIQNKKDSKEISRNNQLKG